MIERYTLPEMKKIWSLENKFSTWLKIEIYACEINAKLGLIPEKSLKNIKDRAGFSVDRIDELEKDLKHDVVAFLTNVNEFVGEDGKYIHFGLTSTDICDTGLSYNMKQAALLIKKKLKRLTDLIKDKAVEYKKVPVMGRTHGIHAEPTTLGLKFALWYSIMLRNQSRLNQAVKIISAGKISGPVGTYSAVNPEVEEYICKKMGLEPAGISTQILQRDRHAQFITTLAVIAGTLEQIATEIRLLQQTELNEVEENFGKKQKGSSAMPHKRNPVGSENICGIARVVKGYASTSLQNIALWHERDISHSSSERIIITDAAILLDYMINRLSSIIENLIVYPGKMMRNINLTGGLIFSSQLLLGLIEKKIYTREESYKIVQSIAMKCYKKNLNFYKEVIKDKRIKIPKKDIKKYFDINRFYKNIDYIYKKLNLPI